MHVRHFRHLEHFQHQADHGLGKRRFPGAVVAEQAQHRAGGDAEVEVPQRPLLAVALAETGGDDATVELAVRDLGPGIPVADRERIFARGLVSRSSLITSASTSPLVRMTPS